MTSNPDTGVGSETQRSGRRLDGNSGDLPNLARTGAYGPLVLAQAPRLLSLLDREARSRTYGSFDREHWAWKFRDFPITMLQAGLYPLALLWRIPLPGSAYFRNPRLLEWIRGAIINSCERQRGNGSFDSVAPYSQDRGVSLAMAHLLTETCHALGDALPEELRERVCQTVRRSCDFATRTREDYAFISNHRALFALGFHAGFELTGDSKYLERAEQVIDAIIQRQSEDGWYEEYGGFDPGYESLAISYLTRYWRKNRSDRLLGSLRRSVEFFGHAVHPDGSVGGVYGSRHTSLYFPDGFEALAESMPMAAATATFLRRRLERGHVVTPATADPLNLAILLISYLEACALESKNVDPERASLPCESLRGVRYFESGLCAAGGDDYYAVVGLSKGGACRVFTKEPAQLAYEDAGYVVRAGGDWWTSQFLGLAESRQEESGAVTCRAAFAKLRQPVPTPWNYLLLRVLNLTLFRSLRLGRVLRRLVIGRLITNRRPGPIQLQRHIEFGPDQIRFTDTLRLSRRLRVDDLSLARSLTAIHMGSAKYLLRSDLESTLMPDTHGAIESLNRTGQATVGFSLRFRSGGAELATGNCEDFRGQAAEEGMA